MFNLLPSGFRSDIKILKCPTPDELKRRSQKIDVTEHSSGVDNFPAITNRHNHLHLVALSIENGNECKLVICERISTKKSSLPKFKIHLRDLWADTPIKTGSTFRLIAPLRLFENVG